MARDKGTPAPRSVVASAARIKLAARGAGQAIPPKQSWQEEALSFIDSVPEVGFGNSFVANQLSKLILYVGYRPPGSDPAAPPVNIDAEESEVPPAVRARANAELDRLRNGGPSHSEILAKLAGNMDAAGEVYIVGESESDDGSIPEAWTARSILEVVRAETGGGIMVRDQPADRGRKLRPDMDTAIRIFTPSVQWTNLATSPMRRLADDCRTLMILTQQMYAESSSRLSAGLMLVANEFSAQPDTEGDTDMDPRKDPFMGPMMEVITAPIEDPSSAASVVPTVVRGPGEWIEKGVRHIQIGRIPDEKLDGRISARIDRLAGGLDLPREVILGHASTTFSNAKQIDADTFEDHLDHRARTLVSGLTKGFLTPNLLDGGVPEEWAYQLLVWFDPSALIAQPDTEQSADEGHDKLTISDAAWRRAKGFDEADAPDEVEYIRRLLEKKGIFDSDLTGALLRAVLFGQPVQLPWPGDPTAPDGVLPEGIGAATIDAIALAELAPAPEPPPQPAPPPMPAPAAPAMPPPMETPAPVTAAGAILAAEPPEAPRSRLGHKLLGIDRDLATRIQVASSQTVERALERAGARIRAKAGALRNSVRAVTNRYAAATVGPTLLADAGLTNDTLLDGAFDDLEAQFRQWGAEAQTEAIEAVNGAVGGFSAAERSVLKLRQAADLDESWGWFKGALKSLTEGRLFNPDPQIQPDGEHDPSLAVPAGAVRNAMSRMGGNAKVHSPDGESAFVAVPGQGGVGTGDTVMDAYVERGGRIVGYRWDYGGSQRPGGPFMPHLDRDGLEFTDFQDAGLENYSSFPPTSHYFPGDHRGCRCFPPGTVVSGSPDVLGATRRWYTGDLIEVVTASGHHLTGTPNHPVLTSHGWVPLGRLCEGDQVVAEDVARGVSGRLAPDENEQPSLIENVFRAINGAGRGSSVSVPGASVDFHGDGSEGQVQVVRSARLLDDWVDPSVDEQPVHRDLKTRPQDAVSLTRGGRLGSPAWVSVSGPVLDAWLEGLRSASVSPHVHRPTDRDARLDQAFADRPPVNAVAVGKPQFAIAGGVGGHDRGIGDGHAMPRSPAPRDDFAPGSLHAAPNQFAVQPAECHVEVSSDPLGALPVQVCLDRVVHVARTESAGGHVYNLSTADGYYVANGIVVHNCDFEPIMHDPPPVNRAGMGDVDLSIVTATPGDSASLHMVDGRWDPDRARMHDEIVNQYLAGYTPPPSDEREMMMMGGGGASGKGYFLKLHPDVVPTGAVTIDADALKALLPEHGTRDDWAAFLHEESSYLTARTAKAAQERGLNIVLDGVGNGNVDKLIRKITQAQEVGYRVTGTYITVPTQTALDRAVERGIKTGRVVPEGALRGAHAGVSKVFPKVYGQFDSVQLWETSDTPILIGSATRGGLMNIDRADLWDGFLGKANG